MLSLLSGVIALAIIFGAIYVGCSLGSRGRRGGLGVFIGILIAAFILAGAHSDVWLPAVHQALLAFHLAK